MSMDIGVNLPKMGGGAIIQLLDENGKEVYNSGFQKNDLTNAGIWHVMENFYNGSGNNYPDARRRNILFLS